MPYPVRCRSGSSSRTWMIHAPHTPSSVLCQFLPARVDVPNRPGTSASTRAVPPRAWIFPGEAEPRLVASWFLRARGCSCPTTALLFFEHGSSPRAWMFPKTDYPHRDQRGFLPARVDVPARSHRPRQPLRVPPRARGCSHIPIGGGKVGGGSSPRAGMFRARQRPGAAPIRFLPARGDVPQEMGSLRYRPEVPPRARGCSAEITVRSSGWKGSSPRARMFPSRIIGRRFRLGFLPARGDVPSKSCRCPCPDSVPPRARGCSCWPSGEDPHGLGSSPRAWMFRYRRGNQEGFAWFLPARVDVPLVVHIRELLFRFLLARVDVPSSGSWLSVGSWVPPRARGCSAAPAMMSCNALGSSPRAWMFRSSRPGASSSARFLPARVDVPQRSTASTLESEVPPRARGCSRSFRGISRSGTGSSPRAWMFPVSNFLPLRRCWFLPARVDVPRTQRCSGCVAPVPPRARGCSDDLPGCLPRRCGSSPRAWMFPASTFCSQCWHRFLPARVDVPPKVSPFAHPISVPPRARGCSCIGRHAGQLDGCSRVT